MCDIVFGLGAYGDRQWNVDRDDNSISRTDAMYKDRTRLARWEHGKLQASGEEIFKKAGLVLQDELRQANGIRQFVGIDADQVVIA